MPVDTVAISQQQFKDELRRLVADNRLQEATKRLKKAASGDAYGAYRAKVLHHAGQLSAYQELLIVDTTAPAELARNRNRLSLGLLELIDKLPDDAALVARDSPPEGFSEDRLKRGMFKLLLAGKVLVILFTGFLWLTGSGLTFENFTTVAGILIPVFATYLMIMVQDVTKNRSILQPGDKRVNKGFARLAYTLVIFYPVVLILILNLLGSGSITFTQLTALMALLETLLGAYLGKVVFGLFRGE